MDEVDRDTPSHGDDAPRAARAVDHVAVVVRDADESARWYTRNLGMAVIGDESVAAAGVRLMYLATVAGEGTSVQLVQPVGPGAVADFYDEHGEGLHHICFSVDDIPRVLTDLDQPSDAMFLGGRGRRACFLTARPNNALIELTETDPVGAPVAWQQHGAANGRATNHHAKA